MMGGDGEGQVGCVGPCPFCVTLLLCSPARCLFVLGRALLCITITFLRYERIMPHFCLLRSGIYLSSNVLYQALGRAGTKVQIAFFNAGCDKTSFFR